MKLPKVFDVVYCVSHDGVFSMATNECEPSLTQQSSRSHCWKRENSMHNIRLEMVWGFKVSNGLQFIPITGRLLFLFSLFKRRREHVSVLSGNSYNLCCHLPSGTDYSCSKWSHFGSNLEEPVSQDSILCSSCWLVLHWLLRWVTRSTLLSFEQIKLGEMTGSVNLSCISTLVVTNTSRNFVPLTVIVMIKINNYWMRLSMISRIIKPEVFVKGRFLQCVESSFFLRRLQFY